jgi:hypothetical protein
MLLIRLIHSIQQVSLMALSSNKTKTKKHEIRHLWTSLLRITGEAGGAGCSRLRANSDLASIFVWQRLRGDLGDHEEHGLEQSTALTPIRSLSITPYPHPQSPPFLYQLIDIDSYIYIRQFIYMGFILRICYYMFYTCFGCFYGSIWGQWHQDLAPWVGRTDRLIGRIGGTDRSDGSDDRTDRRTGSEGRIGRTDRTDGQTDQTDRTDRTDGWTERTGEQRRPFDPPRLHQHPNPSQTPKSSPHPRPLPFMEGLIMQSCTYPTLLHDST